MQSLNSNSFILEQKELDQHISNAIYFFEQGYNCSQAVFMAYSELYGIDTLTAAILATSFGGGMGRLREVCGAVTGTHSAMGLVVTPNQYPNNSMILQTRQGIKRVRDMV